MPGLPFGGSTSRASTSVSSTDSGSSSSRLLDGRAMPTLPARNSTVAVRSFSPGPRGATRIMLVPRGLLPARASNSGPPVDQIAIMGSADNQFDPLRPAGEQREDIAFPTANHCDRSRLGQVLSGSLTPPGPARRFFLFE